MALIRHDHDTPEALADALANAVAANLSAGISRRGTAVLAVSGGSTPKRFFTALSMRRLEWEKVAVTLVDERWVSTESERSNARLVKETLLQNEAAKARFVPLWGGGDLPNAEAIDRVNGHLNDLAKPFDAVVLGMGNDGHTASFFPGGDTLDAALTSKGPALVLNAAGAGEPRVTLTLPVLLNTQALYLHIEGAEKAATLADALGDGPVATMPVRAVLRQTQTPVHLFFA